MPNMLTASKQGAAVRTVSELSSIPPQKGLVAPFLKNFLNKSLSSIFTVRFVIYTHEATPWIMDKKMYSALLNKSPPEPHLPGELPCGCILSPHNPTAVVIVVDVVVDSAAAPHPTVAVPHNSVWSWRQTCLSQRQHKDSWGEEIRFLEL